jgi:20S proteasome alpha/beta subunit
MFTHFYPSSVEFETLERKFEQLHSKRAVLQSSNATPAVTEILESVRRLTREPHDSSVAVLAELVRRSYVEVRLRRIEERIVVPALGPDYVKQREHRVSLADYLKNQSVIYQAMTLKMEQHDLSVSMLVAGVDHSGAHLYHVINPGVCHTMEKLGYGTIGSGYNHALIWLSLARQTRQSDLHTTLVEVYSAKRVSEVAPGVGKETDIAIIDEQRGIWYATAPVLDELRNVYERMAARSQSPDLECLKIKFNEQRNQ